MADAGAATPETPQAPESSQTSQPDFEAWEAAEDAIGTQDALVVSLDGFEGPLDVLLALARTQKVDLAKISVLALADQYLLFIAHAHKLRLELAADYLVMAAWLAYLKSRLLLPREAAAEGQPTGEELAARLAFRLKRLEAMRNAAAVLDDAQAARTRHFRARHAGGHAHHPRAAVYRPSSTTCSRPTPSSAGAPPSACTSFPGARCGPSRRRGSASRR